MASAAFRHAGLSPRHASGSVRASSRGLRHGRRVVLLAALAAAFVGCGGSDEGSPSPERGRPNVVFLSLDTLRQDRCGFHGYERNTTPFLNELSEDSLVFDRAYASAAWTLISHMTMFSGLYPVQHKVWSAEAALTEEVPTLTEVLAGAGAAAVGVHFPGWLDERFGFGRGFVDYRSATDAELAEAQLAELTPLLRERWGFLFVHLFDIHSDSLEVAGSLIYDTPEPWATMFDPDAREVLAGMNAKAVFEAIPGSFTERQREAVRALYDGGIRYVDDKLRDWFADWREQGLLDNAIVIITSDHGEGLGLRERGYGGHGGMFEEGLKVPLLVHVTPKAREWLKEHRGVEAADCVGRRNEVVSHVDILPTVLDALDLPDSAERAGVSLLREVPRDRFVHAQRPPLMVSYRGWDKVRYDSKGSLFGFADLEADPKGKLEVSPRGREAIVAAQALVDEAMQAVSDLPDPGAAAGSGGLTAEERAKLSAIGYGAEVQKR